MASKKKLTTEERLIAAHMHIISGIDQHAISGGFGVNPGRVGEAVTAIEFAAKNPMLVKKWIKEKV